MHNMGIIHRDLKLSNILCKNGVTKIADLGIAKKVTSNNTQQIGTLITMAPEVYQSE